MRISNQLIALSILITSSLALSMDTDTLHRDIAVQRITAVNKPRYVGFFNNKNILMIGNTEGTYEVNWKENKKTALLVKANDLLSCTLNPQRNAIATHDLNLDNSIVQLYDVKKQGVTWKCQFQNDPSFPSYAFTASGKLYVLANKGDIYSSDGEFHFSPETDHWPKGIITSDNEEEQIIFTNTSRLQAITFQKNQIAASTQEVPNYHSEPRAQLHSPISKLIALYYHDGNTRERPWETRFWIIYDRIKEEPVDYLKDCSALAFHPKKESLLAILTKSGFVKIYDFHKRETISQTNCSIRTCTYGAPLMERTIDFSQDGEYLAVIANNRCFVLSNLYPKND